MGAGLVIKELRGQTIDDRSLCVTPLQTPRYSVIPLDGLFDIH